MTQFMQHGPQHSPQGPIGLGEDGLGVEDYATLAVFVEIAAAGHSQDEITFWPLGFVVKGGTTNAGVVSIAAPVYTDIMAEMSAEEDKVEVGEGFDGNVGAICTAGFKAEG